MNEKREGDKIKCRDRNGEPAKIRGKIRLVEVGVKIQIDALPGE